MVNNEVVKSYKIALMVGAIVEKTWWQNQFKVNKDGRVLNKREARNKQSPTVL